MFLPSVTLVYQEWNNMSKILLNISNHPRKKKVPKKDKWDEYVKIAKWTFIVALLIFGYIYFLDLTDSPSRLGIVNGNNSKEWLNFSITYFGTIAASFIGFIGAIMAVSITIEKQNEFRKEDSRKNVLPLVKVKSNTSSIKFTTTISPMIDLANDNKTIAFIALSFENVGQREMYDIWVGGVKHSSKINNGYCNIAPILYKNDRYSDIITSAINCEEEVKTVNISFRIYFKDCYNNWYYQEVSGKGDGDWKASYKIDHLEIKSAPILINEAKLPETIKKKQS